MEQKINELICEEFLEELKDLFNINYVKNLNFKDGACIIYDDSEDDGNKIINNNIKNITYINSSITSSQLRNYLIKQGKENDDPYFYYKGLKKISQDCYKYKQIYELVIYYNVDVRYKQSLIIVVGRRKKSKNLWPKL